ncbi:MAG: insulinase family protein [Bacteroidaceae bacterium]|nr:insulinase family protein [Bacteroidaceae bacterium]
MKKFLLMVACAFMAFGAKAQSQEEMMQQAMQQQLPMDPQTKMGTLPNGLTYYIRHNEYPKGQANFYIAQKVGSVLEEDDQRGLAHFLEHMCFNGTKNFPENQVIKYLESIGVKFGAQLNAYTSIDETVYNINNVPTVREATIDSVLLILHDWSHDLTLDPKEIDKERGVIHEEWRSRSSATMRIYERQLPKLMSNARPGNRLPIGTMEVVDNFKPEALRAYYEKWYRPDQQAIIVVGDLDVARTEAQIKKMFEPIQMPANPAEREYFGVPDNAEPIVATDKDKEQTLTVISVMMKHEQPIPDELKNTVPGMVASLMLNFAQSMLNDRLAEMTQKPETPFLQGGVEDGMFILAKKAYALTTQIVPKEGMNDEATLAVMAEVYRAAKFGFTATEFQRAKSEFMSRIESIYQNKDKRQSDSYVQECVQHFLNKDPMPGIETEYQLCGAILPQLNVEMVNQAFAQLVSMNDSNLVILAMNPDKEGYVQPTEEQLLANIHAAQQMELTAYVDNVKNEPLVPQLPTPGSIVKESDVKFGFKEMVLSNGVKVYMKKTDYKDNEIIMSAYSEGGIGRYPVEDRYTLGLLDRYISASGLGNFTNTELSKALAGVQASCTSSFGEFSEGLHGNCVPKDIRTLFELAYLHFQPLHRDDAAVESALTTLRQTLHNRHANPMTALQDSIQRTMYGNNPRLVIMEEEDVDKASYDRALEIYADRFADASDFSFYFIGNLDEDSIRTYSAQYLANLPVVKRTDNPVEAGLKFKPGIRTNRFAQKQEQPQCIALVVSFAKAKNERMQKLSASFLGQVLSTRYLEKIREEMGAAYSVQASVGLSRVGVKDYNAVMQTVLPVKPEMCDDALKAADDILADLIKNGVKDEEINKIKEHELKNLDEAERLNSSWLSWFRVYMEDGIDVYTNMKQSIQNISSKDIVKMAKQIQSGKNRATIVMMPE